MASTDLDSIRWAVEALQWVKLRKAELAQVEKDARDAVEEALGDNTEGSLDGHPVVTWKFHKRNALDQSVLKQTFPDIYEVCKKVSEVRRFEVVDHDE